MASEAQRLIGISLTKIAQSRTHRGGVSLHKNLLIATVLQKARYIFMEEAYNMVHYQQRAVVAPQQLHHHLQHHHHQQQQLQMQQQVQQTHPMNMQQRQVDVEEEDLVGLTVEEAGIDQTSPVEDAPTGCTKCASNQNTPVEKDKDKNKENHQPIGYHHETLTYLDLDKTPSVLKERTTGNTGTSPGTGSQSGPVCLKRRRAVSEWETEEAVQSILPKRRCSSVEPILTADEEDEVFLDNATQLSETVTKQLEDAQTTPTTATNTNNSSMDSIDRITSLVSIFSFGVPTSDGSTSGNGKLSSTRVSAPDLCSSQAKDNDTIQQRPFLAMTV